MCVYVYIHNMYAAPCSISRGLHRSQKVGLGQWGVIFETQSTGAGVSFPLRREPAEWREDTVSQDRSCGSMQGGGPNDSQ